MKHTNKEKLMKGVKIMAGALPLAFLGPIIIFSSFNNQQHEWYIPILILGLSLATASVFLIFKGVNTMMSALFD